MFDSQRSDGPTSGLAPRAARGDSQLSGFYRLSLAQRRSRVRDLTGLNPADIRILSGDEGLCPEQANLMVENVLGVIGVPLALCANLRVDGRDRLVPMAVEEASVVAAASHAAKLLRDGGGIRTLVSEAQMIGQIQVLEVPDLACARQAVEAEIPDLLARADTCDPCLVSKGGGARGLELRQLPASAGVGPMLVAHLIVDVRDAMGANTVNTMCEHLAPRVEALTGGRVRLRIVSNLADRRTVVATGELPLTSLRGKGGASPEDLALGIQEASVMAEQDPYRAATHNKGIMNGVDAVLVAFGQDWRAVEAGAHAFAARAGRYTALSSWRLQGQWLRGRLELPLPVGVVGGVTDVHPTYEVMRRMAGVTTAADLASLTAAVGLAQNLGALRALAAEGIQQGHMRVHARNVAVAAGATEGEVDRLAQSIADQRTIDRLSARRELQRLREDAREAWEPKQIQDRLSRLRERYLDTILELIREARREDLPPGSPLLELCDYQLETGGKRLRALLPLLVAEALGVEDLAPLLPFAAACEVLHNATLVHDDLQDGDRARRGRPTVWSRYGAARAVNLGDSMFYLAVLLLHRLDLPLNRRLAVERRLMQETLRVLDGQEQELSLLRDGAPTMERYVELASAKTSGLFALPMAGAAAICGAPGELVSGMQEAAGHLGLLFQIQDDLLDLYGDKGRGERGADLREGKRSVLVVHALQQAQEADARWLRALLDRPPDRPLTADEVQAAAALMERLGSPRFAVGQLEDARQRAAGVAGLTGHRPLRALVEGLSALFLEPIAPLLDR